MASKFLEAIFINWCMMLKNTMCLFIVLLFSSFQQNIEEEINDLYSAKKYQDCANLLQQITKENNYVHFRYTYKLASCYAYLHKNDSAYYELHSIVDYFTTLDPTFSVPYILTDYSSFHSMMNSNDWKKITNEIKVKAIKENFLIIDFPYFFKIQTSNQLIRNKINYFSTTNDTNKLIFAQNELIKIDNLNLKKISTYLDKSIKQKKEIKYNWSIINLIIHQSNNIKLKEKYLTFFADNVRKKNLDPYAFAMFYTHLSEQKAFPKKINLNNIKDSVLRSFSN